MANIHHWDFVDEDGCLHCNCPIGVIEPKPGSKPLSPADKLAGIEHRLSRYDVEYNDTSKGLHLIPGARNDILWLLAEVKRLRKMIEAEGITWREL